MGRAQHDPIYTDGCRLAIQAGYRSLPAVKQYKLLDPIRERPDFRDILVSLEKTVQAENLANRESKDDNHQRSLGGSL